MPSQKILKTKQQLVATLVADFKEAKSFVFVDARGVSVLQDTEMRADFRKNNVIYKVIKNTTLILAFKELGISGLEDVFKGPTAIVYSTEDLIAPAKFVKQYADKYEKLTIKAGVLDGKTITVAEVNALASIPSKEVLYGQIVYSLISPIAKLAIALNAIAEKKESEGGKAPEAAATEAVVEATTTEPVAEEAVMASVTTESGDTTTETAAE